MSDKTQTIFNVSKFAAGSVMSAGLCQVITNAVSATMPAEVKITTKILTHIGAFAFSALATKAADNYVNGIVDELQETVGNVQTALKDAKNAQPTK